MLATEEKSPNCLKERAQAQEAELRRLSIASNGQNPKSICLYGNKPDCMCNTCRMNREKAVHLAEERRYERLMTAERRYAEKQGGN